MKKNKVILAIAFAAGMSYAADYFDCWLEQASNLTNLERTHMGVSDKDAICGCFKVKDNPRTVTYVFNAPKPRVMKCENGSCLDSDHYGQCMDHVRNEAIRLYDFAEGGPMAGAIALSYGDGWSMTPFGEYYNARKDRARDIDCFINVHKRPDVAAKEDWSNPAVFKITGLPKILIPEAIGRTPDFSDVRCLDNGELSGFAYNGVLENVRHVNADGEMTGEEIGYMNDPTYPLKQAEKWGKVWWTANYKRGMRDGVATIYKSSVADGSDKEYYFKHLEVNYKQGYVDGVTKMYSDKGILMAEIPMKRGAIHGRMTVRNPFKKKNVPLNFTAGKLEGFNDFADFGGVFHEGLPNGVITYWSVKDTCYEWMPGAAVCHTERLKKKMWGTYKMGKFQGVMECHNGRKGGIDLDCPDPVQDSIQNDPHEIAKRARAAAEEAKQNVQKAREAVTKAQAELAKAEEAAEMAEIFAEEAEAALKNPEGEGKEESAAEPEEEKMKPSKKGKKDKADQKADKKKGKKK